MSSFFRILPHAMKFSMFSGMSLFIMISLFLVTAKSYAITEANISKSFRLNRGAEGGSCNRVSPNGTPMQQSILDDLNDAFEMVDIAVDQIPRATSPDGEKIRWLLKLFFGISFNSDTLKPNASDGSPNAYNLIFGTLQKPYPLDYETPNHKIPSATFWSFQRLNGARRWSVPIPWLRCLEDYAFFSRHILSTDDKEDVRPGAPLAAEYYGIRSKVQFSPLFVIRRVRS